MAPDTSRLRAQLWGFFQDYCQAYLSLDAAAIAAHYLLPGAISARFGRQVFQTTADLVTILEKQCEFLKAHNLSGAQFEIGHVQYLDTQSAVADLGWFLTLATDPQHFRAFYSLAQVNKQWRIFTTQAYPVDTIL